MKILGLWDNVNQHIIQKIIHILDVEEKRTKEQLQVIRYSLTCIVNELEKLILLAIIFTIQRCVDKFVIALLTIVSLRIFMGGSHRETTLGCFLQSFLVFQSIIMLDSIISLHVYTNYIIWILMIIWIWKGVPIVSVKRAHYSALQCMRFKLLAITILFLQNMIIGIVSGDIANLMSWAIAIQLLESGLVGLKLRKEENLNAKY